MPPYNVDCIITAAGLSSRMGKWKMMLPWQQGTVLDASIKNALSFCSRVILVGGYRFDELYQRYRNHPDIYIIHNSDFQTGLFSSVRAATPAICTPFCFITHGDLPCLPAEIWPLLWQQRGPRALLPEYEGIPGHPILLPSPLLKQAVTCRANTIRQALKLGAHRCVSVPFSDITADIDTPEEYRRLYLSSG